MSPLVSFPGLGFWLPAKGDEAYQFIGTTFRIDAAGEKVQIVFRAPKTGNITGFGLTIITLGNAPDNGLKCSLQSIDASGVPSGSILASGNAHVTTAGGTPSATGWFEVTLGAAVAVTRGTDILGAVVEFGGAGWVSPDSVSFGGTNRCGDTGCPYSISGTTTRQTSEFPSFILKYDDGTYSMVQDEVWPAILHADTDIDTGTAANEMGLRFLVPMPLRLRAVCCHMNFAAAGADFELYIYDAAGATVSGPIAIDGDHASTITSSRYYNFVLPAQVVLKPNQEYIFGIKPTTTNNVRLIYYTFNSLAIMDAIPGGSECYEVTRAWSGGTPGAWTRYNTGGNGFRRPRVFLWFDGVDYGVHPSFQVAV